jgi:acetyl esterase/lipase
VLVSCGVFTLSVVRTLVLACMMGGWIWVSPALAAPAQVEETGPAGAGGAVLVLHGGGWLWTGEAQVQANRLFAARFSDRWVTANADYRPGGPESLEDALSAFDALRKEQGPDVPICVFGASSGGQLALMVAEQRDVACVVSDAGPTMLAEATGSLLLLVQLAFGYDAAAYARYSPALHASALRAPVLLGHEAEDPVVPLSQAWALQKRCRDAELIVLPAGTDEMFVHSLVDSDDLHAYFARERSFVDRSIAQWAQAHAPKATAVPQTPAASAPETAHSPAMSSKPKKKRARGHRKHRTASSSHR